MKASVENITRKYMEVDEKIAMIIDDKLRVYKQLLEIMKVKKKQGYNSIFARLNKQKKDEGSHCTCKQYPSPDERTRAKDGGAKF